MKILTPENPDTSKPVIHGGNLTSEWKPLGKHIQNYVIPGQRLCKVFNKMFGPRDHLNELQKLRWSKVGSFGINFMILPIRSIYPDVTSTAVRQVWFR